MLTGIQLIEMERQEQLTKHGRTVERDFKENDGFQLIQAAIILATPNPTHSQEDLDEAPHGWNKELFEKMINKPHMERLTIAGALIAAEIDRLQYEEKQG
jgi:hypothetical protein